MRKLSYLLGGLIISLALAAGARGQWPTTVDEQLLLQLNPEMYIGSEHVVELPGQNYLFIWWEGQINTRDLFYQIVDRYGDTQFPEPCRLFPDTPNKIQISDVIPSGEGGAYVLLETVEPFPDGWYLFIQKLDSLGNKLWGDSGRVAVHFPDSIIVLYGNDLQLDSLNQCLFMAYTNHCNTDYYTAVQKFDLECNPLWPENTVVADTGLYWGFATYWNLIIPDMQGGIYAGISRDISNQNYQYLQHLDSQGNRLWEPYCGILIGSTGSSFLCMDMVSDSAGGVCILTHTAFGNDCIKRYNGAGQMLFSTDVSGMHFDCYLRRGEHNDIYAVGRQYNSNGALWAQRLDLNGNPLWGLDPISVTEMRVTQDNPITYKDGYLFIGFTHNLLTIPGMDLYGQKISLAGEKVWGVDGQLMAEIVTNEAWISHNVCSDGEGGMVAIMRHQLGDVCNAYAKRILADGTLGGDLHSIEDLCIWVQGADAVISWPAQTEARIYNLYISDQPYSFPAHPSWTLTDTLYVDENAVNEGDKFYRVTWEQ